MYADSSIRRLTARSGAALTAAFLLACKSTDATSTTGGTGGETPLAQGGSAFVATGSTVTVPGGSAGGEYVFVVTDTATDGSSAATTFQVATTGVGAAGIVSLPSTSRSPIDAADVPTVPVLDFGFAARLNNNARAVLGPRVSSARLQWNRGAAAPVGLSRSVSALAPQVGDALTLNVSSNPCDSIVPRGTRIVAIGTQSIVVADTLNPTGGFTQADYQRFAARFDTLVYPIDVENFGVPAVFGPEGKIVLFFTSAVNALTPAKSESYVGGFFFGRDLFPLANSMTLAGCGGSNTRNIFYLLAPDPAGAVNGNVRRTGFVDSVTTSVLAHEFQHLINASRRLYVNQNAAPNETIWLNEGLSHIAEELLFYHEGQSGPQRNLDVAALRASRVLVTAFNTDQVSNATRYRQYLVAPSTNSPIRNDDSLATRGATWDFLRYAADRKERAGGTDASVWQALVNSRTSGIMNLKQVFGANLGGMLRDWSVSHYADDIVPGVSVDFMQQSWNWHTIYPALGTNSTYPLLVSSLVAATTSGSVIPGGAAYYRFSVAASATGTITLTRSGATSSPLQGVLIRLR
ncbi:hypothetical protein BH11GEM1_BH11GEM1_36460 [soil metagenome]